MPRIMRYLIPLWLATLAAGLLFPASQVYAFMFAILTAAYILEK